nr:hypothetical protein [Tanacetum cinerariifolium]
MVMENHNHLNEPNEAIPEVNPVVPETNQVADIHDPNEMVDILNDINLVDYDKEDPEEDPEEEPKEDVDIELEDDAELIFPYEVEGDKTLPPGDVSSDFGSSDSESEDEEVDVAPEATAGTITQKPYVIHDFSRGLFERALGNVLERVSVLDSEENATLKKRLAETETKLVRACMERDIAERRLHESRVWNKRFYLDMVCIGAIPKPSSDDEDTEHLRKKSKNSTSDGTEGPSELRGPPNDSYGVRAGGAGAGGTGAGGAGADGAGAAGAGVGGARPAVPKIIGCTYITFMRCEPHPFKGTKGHALTWWNGRIASMGIDAANGTNIDGYTNRFHKLALLYPRMVEPEQVKVEQYIRGLSKNIRGDVTSSRPDGIDEAVCMAYQLMGQIIQDKTDEVSEGEKRKGEGDRGGRGDNQCEYNHWSNQRRDNARAMANVAPNDNEVCPKCKNKKHGGDCWKCGKHGKLGHKTAACWSLDIKDVTCFNCNEKGHRKRDCPKLKKNGQGGNNYGLYTS